MAPCQDVRFSNLFDGFDRPLASYAARSPGRNCHPSGLGTALVPEPAHEMSERGDDEDVGMERGEKSGDEAEADVVELDLICCEFEGENGVEPGIGMHTWGRCV